MMSRPLSFISSTSSMPPRRQTTTSPAPPEPFAAPAAQVVQETTAPHATNKRKRTELTISLKAEIIKHYEDAKEKGYKITFRSIGKTFGISSGAVSKIIQNKDAVLKRNEDSPEGSNERKRLYKRNMQPVEDALFRWFLKQREYGNPCIRSYVCDRRIHLLYLSDHCLLYAAIRYQHKQHNPQRPGPGDLD